MITEGRVVAHIQTLNRVPDPGVLDLPDVSSSAFLERQRRPAMSRIEQSEPGVRRWIAARRLPAFALSAAVIFALVGVAVWLAGNDDRQAGSPATPLELVQEHVRLRLSGELTAALQTMTPELRQKESDFYEALEVWNLRGTMVTPCRAGGNQHTIRCVVSESNEFLEAAGLSPWQATITFTVSDDLLIRSLQPSVNEYPQIVAFDSAFRRWMDAAHPEESARMAGGVASGSIDADDARIALQYVEEFVAQSDRYPLQR